MKRIFAGIACLLAPMAIATAQMPRTAVPKPPESLNELIQENVSTAVRSSKAYAEPARVVPQLWIHTRNADQQRLSTKLSQAISGTLIDGQTIAIQPVQLVAVGPTLDELRFFKTTDRAGAEALLLVVKKSLPRVRLNDLSAQYANVTWLRPGHYELWLAPDSR
jgi:hypothetical protein